MPASPPLNGGRVDRYLHIGGDWWNRCGDGWVNIDMAFSRYGVPEGYYARDVFGRKLLNIGITTNTTLPYESNSIDFVYSEHMIEHVLPDAFAVLVAEIHRVLRPGAVARLSTPDLKKYIRGYHVKSDSFLETHAKRYAPMQARGDKQSALNLGAPTRATIVNNIFQNYGHKWIYDYDEIVRVAAAVNVREVCLSNTTNIPKRVRRIMRRAQHPSNPDARCWLDQPMRAHESMYVHIFKRFPTNDTRRTPGPRCIQGTEHGMRTCTTTA